MAISVEIPGTLRPGAVFSTAFKAFGSHAAAFIALSVISRLPGFLWTSAGLYYADAVRFFYRDALVAQALSAADFACVIIGYGAIIHAAMQGLAGRPVPIAGSIAIAARRSVALLGVLLAAEVLILMAERLQPPFIWSGILTGMQWLLMWSYFIVAPVRIGEGVGLGAALSRCRSLTEGCRWQIFGAILLVGIAGRTAFTVARGGMLFFSGMMVVDPVAARRAIIVTYIVAFSLSVVIGAVNAVVAAVFYHKLRSIKDGVGIADVFD